MADQELNLKFVGEVEKYEELYNYTLPGYSRKDVTEKAWQQVAFKMNMSAAECKEKWRNLRTVFIRKMKPPPSGSGAKKKAYYLETAMQFCLPFMKTLAPPSYENLSPTDDDVGAVENTEIYCANGSMTDISYPVQFSQKSSTRPSSCKSPALSQSEHTSSEQQKTFSSVQDILRTRVQKNFSLKHEKSTADPDQYVAEYFRTKKAKIQPTEEGTGYQKIDRQESIKMFLLSMLPELEELSDSQIKVFKRRVLSLIDEISTPPQNPPQTASQNPTQDPS